MPVSMTLFESFIVLAVTGVFVVAWWGVKRIVQTNDDEAKTLKDINNNLKNICERLAKGDMWMEMHTTMDDERYEQTKISFADLKKVIENEVKLRRSDNG